MPSKKASPARSKSPSAAADTSELGLIRSLADLLNTTGLTEIELERKGVRVRVSRGGTVYATAPAPTHPAPAAPAAAAPPQPAVSVIPADAVKSPMVGTIYRAAQPGSPNFVEVGTEVKAGQTLLIIEAMKTMNQIPAPRAGKITQIYVQNGSPVEYGEALVLIE
ncbi:MAG TPA: acetyl-CoA carboxylase biotin carboxyl carrier protein [Nordella sp.]|nr:acetyl-CoA carboxylase biotin carboxyl carrier protein [Nordella sp.]